MPMNRKCGALIRAVSVAAIAYVVLTINASVYWARAMYKALYPGAFVSRPPSVSGTLRDPLIGEPFGFWVGISALILAVAVLPVARLHYRAAGRLRLLTAGGGAFATRLTHIAITAQMVSVCGVLILSQYRFPDYGREHIIGSYLFFIGQALAVACSTGVMIMLRRNFGTGVENWRASGLMRRLSGARILFGTGTLALALVYVVLFAARNLRLEDGSYPVYPAYALAEPVLISLYLFYLLTFTADLWCKDRSVNG